MKTLDAPAWINARVRVARPAVRSRAAIATASGSVGVWCRSRCSASAMTSAINHAPTLRGLAWCALAGDDRSCDGGFGRPAKAGLGNCKAPEHINGLVILRPAAWLVR